MRKKKKKSSWEWEQIKKKRELDQLKQGSRSGESTPMIIRNVPEHLRLEFKQWCKKHGYRMAEKIRSMMRETIRGDRL